VSNDKTLAQAAVKNRSSAFFQKGRESILPNHGSETDFFQIYLVYTSGKRFFCGGNLSGQLFTSGLLLNFPGF